MAVAIRIDALDTPDRGKQWPQEIAVAPRIGDYITSIDGKNTRRITTITHQVDRGTPVVLITFDTNE